MNDNSARDWFLKKFSKDLFVVAAVTWVVLFVMENVKQGIVSNYLSLPHFAALLFFFGLAALYFNASVKNEAPSALKRKDYIVLTVFSVLLALFLFLILKTSPILTVLVIFVTVLALWLGTLILNEK